MTLKKFCGKSGCNNLCDLGQRYCSDHEHLLKQQQATRHKQYDQQIRHTRDKQYAEFYHSDEWETTRVDVLNLYHSVDLYAYYVDHRIVKATMVHHIIELRDDWSKRLDLNNLIPLSSSIHGRLSALYKRDKQGAQEMLRGLLERWNAEMKG